MTRIKKVLFAFSFGIGLAYALPAFAAPDAETCRDWVDMCHEGDANACYQFNRLASYCHSWGVFM